MINKESLISFFNLINKKAKDHYDDFNSLDGQLGDGDLGITLTKGIEEICNNKDNFENDIGKIFLLCAKLFTKVSSSSFGTLTAISFLTFCLFKISFEILILCSSSYINDIVLILSISLDFTGLKKFSNLSRWYKEISERDAVKKGYDLLNKGEKIPKI